MGRKNNRPLSGTDKAKYDWLMTHSNEHNERRQFDGRRS